MTPFSGDRQVIGAPTWATATSRLWCENTNLSDNQGTGRKESFRK